MKKEIKLPKWKDKNLFEKILHIVGLLIAVLIIILAFIQLFDIYKTVNIFEILLGILMFTQALQYWKYDKITAIFSLVAAIIISICGIIILFL